MARTYPADIANRRLRSQRISGAGFKSPGEVVVWLGAVQAQDYLGSLWALGVRMKAATEEAVERAIADRTVVRTWPMRGTLHFVAPADVRWMLALLTPRVIAGLRSRHRQLELDPTVFDRSRVLLTGALAGGCQLTRGALFEILDAAGISTAGQRGIHILSRLSMEGLLCFAALTKSRGFKPKSWDFETYPRGFGSSGRGIVAWFWSEEARERTTSSRESHREGEGGAAERSPL